MFKPLDYILNSTGFSRSTPNSIRANPTIEPCRTEPDKIVISIYEYDKEKITTHCVDEVEEIFKLVRPDSLTWINIDGLRKADVETVCVHFGIHALIAEDILSIGHRPKMDELNGILYCLLYMLSYDDVKNCVNTEQVSIILGENFVLSLQEDAHKDPFNPLREKLKLAGSKVRVNKTDFLFYSLLDYIVDHYFVVLDKMGDKIEILEEEIIKKVTPRSIVKINGLRKELIVLKRNIAPVRELVGGIMRSESELIEDNTEKYFKDIYDHIVQANDISENYRDLMMNVHDLYINNMNMKMNEVMKVMAIVTCLLAPATVIGGIFGMNFDVIPIAHKTWGFFGTVSVMLVVPIIMLVIFRKRGWF